MHLAGRRLFWGPSSTLGRVRSNARGASAVELSLVRNHAQGRSSVEHVFGYNRTRIGATRLAIAECHRRTRETRYACTCSCSGRMTWVKSQPELPAKMAADDLSESACLAHFQAISWVSGIEKFDCVIPRRLLASALPCTLDVAAAKDELVAAHYWFVLPNGDVELNDHAGFIKQSLVTVSKKRTTDAQSAKRYRDKQSPSAAASVTDGAADSVTQSDTASVPRLPTDLASYRQGEEPPDVPEQGSEPWPEVSPPGSSARDTWRTAARGYDR